METVVALAFTSIVFRDFLIEASLLVVSVAIVAELAWTVAAARGLRRRFVLTREGAGTERIVLQPGQESVEQVALTKNIGGSADIVSRTNFLEIKPGRVEGQGSTLLRFTFATEYAGEYACSEVGITASGPLGLFSLCGSVPFDLKYVVYPRLVRVAAAAVRLLALGEIGETPIDLPGVGSEYYEMREYHPGDDVRRVNWKASARGGGLVVVEHMREVGSHLLLVLDTRSRGFDESDRLATAFLSVANSLWTAGVDFGVLVHDGKTISEFSTEENKRMSLRAALHAAVSAVRLGSPELLELVPVREVAGGRLDFSGDIFAELAATRHQSWRQTLEGAEPWTTITEYLRSSQATRVVFFSSLAGDVRPLVELAWESRHYRNVEFTVANPCEANLPSQKASRALSDVGAAYHRGEPAVLARRILA